MAACIDCTTGQANPPARVCDNCQPARLSRQLEAYTGNSYPVTARYTQEALPMTTDVVATFVTEADAFTRRHPELNPTQQAMGGTAMGMMRAVLECPDHPGSYRVPQDAQWVTLVCPVDGNTWVTADGQPATLPEPASKRAVKAEKQCPDCGATKGVAHRDDCSVSRVAPKGIDRSQMADASITDHPFTPWKTAPKRCNTCGKVAPRHAVVQA